MLLEQGLFNGAVGRAVAFDTRGPGLNPDNSISEQVLSVNYSK